MNRQEISAIDKIQGFITSENRFIDRKEAAKIWVEQGGKINYSTEELYSEDIY